MNQRKKSHMKHRDLKELNDRLTVLRDEILAQGDNVDPALAAEFNALWYEAAQEVVKVVEAQWDVLKTSITQTHSYLKENGIIK